MKSPSFFSEQRQLFDFSQEVVLLNQVSVFQLHIYSFMAQTTAWKGQTLCKQYKTIIISDSTRRLCEKNRFAET